MPDLPEPAHYTQGQVHCIDAMVSAFDNEAVIMFCQINAFKYLWRCRSHKDGSALNMQKAIWYLQYALKLTEQDD